MSVPFPLNLSLSEADYDNLCTSYANTVFYTPFQLVWLINAILSITAIFTCTYFVKTYIWNSTFHFNFKLLITMYFFAALFHSILYTASYSLLVERLLNYREPCDVILPKERYTIIHSLIGCCLMCGMFTEVFMVIERVYATINVQTYEFSNSICHVITYVFFSILLPISLLIWAYEEADFSYPVISATSPPRGVEIRLNVLFIAAFMMAVAALILLRIIKHINTKHEHNSSLSLSGRYQILENIYTTKFITSILLNNMIIAVIYITGTFILRNVEFEIFKDKEPLLATLKGFFYLHPFFSFLLPLISSWHLNQIKKERLKRSERILQLKTKGREGSDAYNQLLNDQWSQQYFVKA